MATWPELPYARWQDTCMTLRLWTQIVGKIRLVQSPWLNHSWHVPLYVDARGLTTSLIAHGDRAFDLSFDFIDSVLVLRTSEGAQRRVALAPQSVADFHRRVMAALDEVAMPVRIDDMPNEIEGAIRFSEDRTHCAYDAGYAQRFWRVLLQVDRVLHLFRTGFIGKCQPRSFLLGKLRHRGDAFFRPHRAAASRWRSASSGRRRSRGVFARSQQLRVLARRWRPR